MNTPIRDVRDSFLHFLADNLGSIPLNPLRSDPNDPGAGILKTNAINVQFLDVRLDSVATQQVVIDILNDSSNTAADWMEAVWVLLRSAFYTPLFNYTIPASPVAQHTNIMWDRNSVKFSRVVSDNYTHYSCVLPLKFYAII